MKRLILRAAMTTALSLPAAAGAYFYSGNDLYKALNGDSVDGHLATGYVAGVVDSLGNTTSYGMCFRIPKGVNLGQIKDVFRRYLDENPEIRHQAADYLLVRALSRPFPCTAP